MNNSLHVLIVGQGMSGKTLLCKQLAKKFIKNYGVIVYDPINDPAWPATFKTDDPEKFEKVLWASTNCKVFIDECGDMFESRNREKEKIGFRSRHRGHIIHFIAQRATQVPKTVRLQCTHLFCFRQGLDDLIELARNFNDNLVEFAKDLQKGEYVFCDGYGTMIKDNIFKYV